MKRTFLIFFGGAGLIILTGFVVLGHKSTNSFDVKKWETIVTCKKDTTGTTIVKHAEAIISGVYADTTVTGTIKFDLHPSGKVMMNLELLIPSKAGKTVAVHIHAHGDCANSGMAAHGHWNPTNTMHGKWGEGNFHAGDIGNIKLDTAGRGIRWLTTDLWTLGGNEDKNILGKSIIVHGGTDDHTSQPAGNSGTRIGCGVIQ